MAKLKTSKETIESKIQRLNKLLVTDRNNPEVKKLQSEIEFVFWGIVI